MEVDKMFMVPKFFFVQNVHISDLHSPHASLIATSTAWQTSSELIWKKMMGVYFSFI
jgi:hypothetical protein